DFYQRNAAAVVVNVGAAVGVRKAFVQRLARVLFHVDTRQPDPFRRTVTGDLEATPKRERPLVLGDLVPLRKIRIEVVLARKDRLWLHRAAKRQCRLDGVVDRQSVEDRERARQTEADRAHLGVRRSTESGAAAAENLGLCLKLGVNLEPDDGLVLHA